MRKSRLASPLSRTLLFRAALCALLVCLAAPAQAQDPVPANDQTGAEVMGDEYGTPMEGVDVDKQPTPPPELPEDAYGLFREDFKPDALMSRVCQKALAASTCKQPAEFNYVLQKGNAYMYNAFYGSRFQDFYCYVLDGRMVLSGVPWGKSRLSVPYEVDSDTKCVTARIGITGCGSTSVVTVCKEEN